MTKIYSNDIRLIKRKSNFLKIILLILLVTLMVVGILGGSMGLSNLLSKRGFVWFKTDQIKISSMNYYVLHFGEFEKEEDASKCATWTLMSGGSAYVYKTDKYLVSAQIYDNIDKANKVVEGLNGDLNYQPQIKHFKTEKTYFKVSSVSVADKRKLEKIINSVGDVITKVLEISNKLDMGLLSNVAASSEVNSLKSDIKINKTHIDSINATYNNSKLTKLSDYYLRMVDNLDICVNKLLTNENYITACKYCACEIFFDFYDFMLDFAK